MNIFDILLASEKTIFAKVMPIIPSNKPKQSKNFLELLSYYQKDPLSNKASTFKPVEKGFVEEEQTSSYRQFKSLYGKGAVLKVNRKQSSLVIHEKVLLKRNVNDENVVDDRNNARGKQEYLKGINKNMFERDYENNHNQPIVQNNIEKKSNKNYLKYDDVDSKIEKKQLNKENLQKQSFQSNEKVLNNDKNVLVINKRKRSNKIKGMKDDSVIHQKLSPEKTNKLVKKEHKNNFNKSNTHNTQKKSDNNYVLSGYVLENIMSKSKNVIYNDKKLVEEHKGKNRSLLQIKTDITKNIKSQIKNNKIDKNDENFKRRDIGLYEKLEQSNLLKDTTPMMEDPIHKIKNKDNNNQKVYQINQKNYQKFGYDSDHPGEDRENKYSFDFQNFTHLHKELHNKRVKAKKGVTQYLVNVNINKKRVKKDEYLSKRGKDYQKREINLDKYIEIYHHNNESTIKHHFSPSSHLTSITISPREKEKFHTHTQSEQSDITNSHNSENQENRLLNSDGLVGSSDKELFEKFQKYLDLRHKQLIKIDFQNTKINVHMQRSNIMLHFASSQSLFLEGIDDYVSSIMKEHNFDNYEVKITDKNKNILIQSKKGMQKYTRSKSMIDVKV